MLTSHLCLNKCRQPHYSCHTNTKKCAFVVLQPDTLPRTVVVHGLAELVALAKPQHQLSCAVHQWTAWRVQSVFCKVWKMSLVQNTLSFLIYIYINVYIYIIYTFPFIYIYLYTWMCFSCLFDVVPRFLGFLICQSLCSLHKASAMRILKVDSHHPY